MPFRNFVLVFALLLFSLGCRRKKVSLAGNDPVTIGEFIDFFETRSLPFQLDDQFLDKKENDSLLISNKIFRQFIPDTFLQRVYGKGSPPRFYAVGKTAEPKREYYLFVKAVSGRKRKILLLCFDSKKRFRAGLPVLEPDQNPLTVQSMTLDRNFTIIKTIQRANAQGSIQEGKDAYIYNADAGNFTLILTDPLEEKPPELINPIDTLPGKNKLSGDYLINKRNLVSIRDGRKSGRIIFFIHFEQNNGECTGEVKGEAVMKSSRVAEYRATGNPCHLLITFTGSSVTIQEKEACGSYRGVYCQFRGTYFRKKEKISKSGKPSSVSQK